VLFSEPKIPQTTLSSTLNCCVSRFQCSSASRKFLNRLCSRRSTRVWKVSVLFSEPKIPQLSVVRFADDARPKFQCSSASRKFLNASYCWSIAIRVRVSVLFSEPKIPQPPEHKSDDKQRHRFSALQRAENSSTWSDATCRRSANRFQCSSASRKFLNPAVRAPPHAL